MARESTGIVGSGISALREDQNVRVMGGTNNVLVNYEDVNSSLGIMQGSGLVVAAAAVHLTGPATRLRGRRKLLVQNLGTGNLFIGNSAVTAAAGYRLASGESLELDVLDYGDIYGISDSNADVRVLELR